MRWLVALAAGFGFTALGTLVGVVVAREFGTSDDLILASLIGAAVYSVAGWFLVRSARQRLPNSGGA